MNQLARAGTVAVCVLAGLGLAATRTWGDKYNYAWCKNDTPRESAHCQGQGPPDHENVPTPHQLDVFHSVVSPGESWNFVCRPNDPYPGNRTCCDRESYGQAIRWYFWRSSCTQGFPPNPTQTSVVSVWESCNGQGVGQGAPPPPGP